MIYNKLMMMIGAAATMRLKCRPAACPEVRIGIALCRAGMTTKKRLAPKRVARRARTLTGGVFRGLALPRLASLILYVLAVFGANTSIASPWIAAKRVWARGDENKENCARVFEGEFVWRQKRQGTVSPVLRIASSYPYRAELNGEFAGYGPARAPKGVFRVDEWPLQEVRDGTNTLRITSLAHNIPTYEWMKQPAFVQCEVVVGNRVLLSSDAMTCRELETYVDTKRRYSFQRGWQERYKCCQCENVANVEMFPIANSNSQLETGSSPHYIPRGIPYPRFEVVTPKAIAKDGGMTRYDAGLDDTGFIMLDIHAATTGEVRVVWDEILSNGKVNHKRGYTSSELVVEVASPGDWKIETLEPYTGRYFELTAPKGVDCIFSLREYKYPFQDIRTDDKILAAARETFAQNAADGLTDCPGRERAGWLCDSFFTGRAEQFLTGSNAVERAFLENYALAESFDGLPDGMVPMCFPADHSPDRTKGRNFIPNWAMWLVLHADDYVRRTGDRKMAERLKTKFEGIERYFRDFENVDGLLEKLRGWVFVEWSRANRLTKGVNYPSNMLYAEMLDALDRLYKRPELAKKAAAIREKIREKSFDGEFFRDHNLSDEATEVCQYYAFFTHTATPESHPQLWNRLVSDFGPRREASKTWPKIAPANAFIGNFLRFELLRNAGLGAQVRREAEDYFREMADKTGTLWEHSKPTASCCHGFASYAAVLWGCLTQRCRGQRGAENEELLSLQGVATDMETCSCDSDSAEDEKRLRQVEAQQQEFE